MSGWSAIAKRRSPPRGEVDLGPALDRLVNDVLSSLAAVKGLLFLMTCAPEAKKAGEIASATGETRSAVSGAMDRLAEAEILECLGGLFSKRWRYLRENPESVRLHNFRKLWKHPRTHGVLMYKILEQDGSVKE